MRFDDMPGERPRVLDDGMSHRLKALATTAPLHDLDARKVQLSWLSPGAKYQMAEIALKIIDAVTIAMDFDRGAAHDDVIRQTIPFVAVQHPGAPVGEHERVARWVLDNLLSMGTQERGFTATYGTISPAGEYERRSWPFKILIELYGEDGSLYLRSTDEAINVLVGALNVDVESAQFAAEHRLRTLIERGRLSDAREVARQARLLTSQYADQMRRKLDATRRDVRAVDWEKEVPDLINEALDHIEARTRVEQEILKNISQARDDADDADRKAKAADLVELVRDCLRRHSQLQTRLQAAGRTFRAEQDRQEFSGGPARRDTVDLFGHLLAPTLELPLAQAQKPTGAFFAAGTGLADVTIPRLVDVVYMLLEPPQNRDDLGEEIVEPDLVPARDPDVWSTEQWEAADRLLDVDAVPRRLSALLAEARALDPELPHLIGLRVLHAVDPSVTAAVKQGDTTALLAVDDGTVLDDPEFGGSDLLVALVPLDPTAATHPDQETDAAPSGKPQAAAEDEDVA